jgi:hypothetical protein
MQARKGCEQTGPNNCREAHTQTHSSKTMMQQWGMHPDGRTCRPRLPTSKTEFGHSVSRGAADGDPTTANKQPMRANAKAIGAASSTPPPQPNTRAPLNGRQTVVTNAGLARTMRQTTNLGFPPNSPDHSCLLLSAADQRQRCQIHWHTVHNTKLRPAR